MSNSLQAAFPTGPRRAFALENVVPTGNGLKGT
jgi:hypothetical protein